MTTPLIPQELSGWNLLDIRRVLHDIQHRPGGSGMFYDVNTAFILGTLVRGGEVAVRPGRERRGARRYSPDDLQLTDAGAILLAVIESRLASEPQ